jgi:hypothetical protein
VTVVARRVASVPVRTAVGTWERLVEIVTAPGSNAHAELTDITSIAAMLIADEQTKDDPVTVSGGGPLVRVYTAHGDDAVEHDDADEADLPFNPTSGDDWMLTLPASSADVAVVEEAVAGAPHVTVRDVDAAAADEERAAAKAAALSGALEVDLTELERP